MFKCQEAHTERQTYYSSGGQELVTIRCRWSNELRYHRFASYVGSQACQKWAMGLGTQQMTNNRRATFCICQPSANLLKSNKVEITAF